MIARLAMIAALSMPMSASAADEWIDLTIHVRVHPNAYTVSDECIDRAKRRGRVAWSAMPSCFAQSTAPGGGPCIVIARRPNGFDDLAARERIGAEIENCIAGHVFPVNPE